MQQTAATWIEKQDWLDGVGDKIGARLTHVYGSVPPARRLLQGTSWLGHPLHAVVTDIPLGAWAVALALDLGEIITGQPDLTAGADAAIGIGLTGAVASAVTGWADWVDTEGTPRRVGLVHALLNGGAAALYTASAALRTMDRRRAGVALSMLGFGAVCAASWLGGRLVYQERVGVEPYPSDAEA